MECNSITSYKGGPGQMSQKYQGRAGSQQPIRYRNVKVSGGLTREIFVGSEKEGSQIVISNYRILKAFKRIFICLQNAYLLV